MKTYILVVNGLGIGAMPDYSRYQSKPTDTFADVAFGLQARTLRALGFYNIFGAHGDSEETVIATFARIKMLSNRCDFDSGLVEILGNVRDYDIQQSPIRDDLLSRLRNFGFDVTVLGDSGTVKSTVKTDNDIEIVRYIESGKCGDLTLAIFNEFTVQLIENGVDGAQAWLLGFNAFLERLLDKIGREDLLIIVGNQGVDVAAARPSREYSPVVLYSRAYPAGRDLGTVQGLDTVAMSVVDHLGVYTNDRALLSSRIIEGYRVDATVARLKSRLSGGNKSLRKRDRQNSISTDNRDINRDNLQ